MSTNVRPGDLARVVAPYFGPGRGAVVTVLARRIGEGTVCGNFFGYWDPCWLVQGWVHSEGGLMGPMLVIGDESLRRIPPKEVADAIDEMIIIAGPSPEHGRIREWEGQA